MIVFVIVLLVIPLPAHAYIDPGMGVLLVQLAMAGLIGTAFFIRRISLRFKKIINGLVTLPREIRDFSRLLRQQTRGERMVVVYAEHQGYYPYFEGIIRELQERHQVTVCYITSERSDPVLNRAEGRLKTFYLHMLLPYWMLFMSMPVMLMTVPELNVFHLKRSLRPVHYVYVFHSLVSTHMQYRENAFDAYDSILCPGSHHRAEIRAREQIARLPAKKLVDAGYYRLERVYNAYQAFKESHSQSASSRVVLIAPSWGKDNMLETVGQVLVGKLLDAHYQVILRPHPEMTRRAPELIDSYRKQFYGKEGFMLEESIVGDDSLLRADVLFTDWSGIAFEYALGTERPVIFLDVPKKVHNLSYETLGLEPLEVTLRPQLGKVLALSEIDRVDQIVHDFLRLRQEYQEQLAALRSRVVYNFGHSSEVSADYVASLLPSLQKS